MEHRSSTDLFRYGLANGDSESIVTGTLVRAIGENAGIYAIRQGTLAATGNYDITYTGA